MQPRDENVLFLPDCTRDDFVALVKILYGDDAPVLRRQRLQNAASPEHPGRATGFSKDKISRATVHIGGTDDDDTATPSPYPSPEMLSLLGINITWRPPQDQQHQGCNDQEETMQPSRSPMTSSALSPPSPPSNGHLDLSQSSSAIITRSESPLTQAEEEAVEMTSIASTNGDELDGDGCTIASPQPNRKR